MSKRTRVPVQVQTLALGLVLWSLHPVPEWWALVFAYGVAWVVMQWGRGRALRFESEAARWAVTAAVLLAPLAILWRWGPDFRKAEGLVGLGTHLEDRRRLEADPAIAPPAVWTDRPQTFYVRARGAASLEMELGKEGPVLRGTEIGPGLFLVGYDPAVDGRPPGQGAELDVAVSADGNRSRRRLRRFDPAPHPRWFCQSPELGLAAAPSEETDALILVHRDGTMSHVETDDGPVDCAFFEVDGQARLVVSHRYATHLLVLDLDLVEVGRLELGPFQGRLAVDPSGQSLAVGLGGSDPRIALLGAAGAGRLEVVGRIRLDGVPEWITFGRDANELVVSDRLERSLLHFQRVDLDWTASESLRLGRPAVALTRSHGGDRIFVATTDYRPDGKAHRGNHFIQDQILTVDVEAWSVTGQFMTARRTERQQFPGGLDAGVSPMGLAHRADGSMLVSFAGSEEVWQINDDFRGPPRVFDLETTELIAPHGVADLGDGVWAASSPAGGAVAVFRGSERIAFHGVAQSDKELASASQSADDLAAQALSLRRGERAFYEASRSGMSCQSCHLHGESDASSHDIGQAPLLPTLTVRGLVGTSPYLRDGSFPRIRDLHHGLAEPLMRGYRRFAASRPEDLERFVESLPRRLHPEHLRWLRTRSASDPLVDRWRRGAPLFERASCSTCHPAPAFTHLGSHPVRALFPEYGEQMPAWVQLDTPSLLGLGDKGHWLQDGRAHSLEEVLVEENRSNRHGDTAALEPSELETLARFLEVL
ncbi:MAG: hypothetical protein AAGM22_05685 [Acidobacteriota bacterium]